MDQMTQAPARPGGGDDGIRILVADRSAHYRETIRRVLDGYDNCTIVGEASNLAEAVVLATEAHPDLVLLDFDLVANEKVARVKKLAETFPDLRVVVLLTDYSPDYRQAVQVRWGYLCLAKDRVEEHLAWIIADIKPTVYR